MVDGDARLQAGHGGMVLAQPFLADFQRARDLCFILQQRVEIAALAQVNDLLAVALDPVGLGGKDQGPLTLAGKLPGREQGKVRVLARIWVFLLSLCGFLLDEFVEEWTVLVEIKPQKRVLAAPC